MCSAGLSLHHSSQRTLDAARLVSTPFPFGTWLGIAISKVSPTLSSSTRNVSNTAPNLFRNLVLYPTELRGGISFLHLQLPKVKNTTKVSPHYEDKGNKISDLFGRYTMLQLLSLLGGKDDPKHSLQPRYLPGKVV